MSFFEARDFSRSNAIGEPLAHAAELYAELADEARSIRELDGIFIARCAELDPSLGEQRPVHPSVGDRFSVPGPKVPPGDDDDEAPRGDWMTARRAGDASGWRRWRLANHMRVRNGREYPRLRGSLLPAFRRKYAR